MPPHVYFLLAATALFWIVRNRAKISLRFRALFGDALRFQGGSGLALDQRWAIAAGADLALRNFEFLDALPTGNPLTRQLLTEWWGIDTREDALEMLRFLGQEGHRAPYQKVVAILGSRPEAMQRTLLAQIAAEHAQPVLIETYEAMLGAQRVLVEDGVLAADAALPSILAWDLGRLINICRWCYDVELLRQHECWKYMLPAANALQREYNSWGELSTAYLMGLLVWKGGERAADYELCKYNRKLLLTDARSPWRQLAWAPQAVGELAHA